MQHRDDALAVMPVGRRDVDRQREAIINPILGFSERS
jgi:hypothetical protein